MRRGALGGRLESRSRFQGVTLLNKASAHMGMGEIEVVGLRDQRMAWKWHERG